MQTRPYRVHGTNTFEPIGKQGMQALDSLFYCTGCPWDERNIQIGKGRKQNSRPGTGVQMIKIIVIHPDTPRIIPTKQIAVHGFIPIFLVGVAQFYPIMSPCRIFLDVIQSAGNPFWLALLGSTHIPGVLNGDFPNAGVPGF